MRYLVTAAIALAGGLVGGWLATVLTLIALAQEMRREREKELR